MGNDLSIKWVIGGISAVGMFLITFLISHQTNLIEGLRAEAQAGITENQKYIQRVDENARRTAEALRAVTETINQIDQRGTLALRDHEREKHE